MPARHSNSVNTPDFFDLQHKFTAYIRNPLAPAPSGVEGRRMAVYAELLFNNIENFMSGSFPITREILGDDAWMAIMRDYYQTHKAKTPLFPYMPKEFLEYLKDRQLNADDPPFLFELAQYEWAEIEMAIFFEEDLIEVIDPHTDLLDSIPVLSRACLLFDFHYPVHKISSDYRPLKHDQMTFLVVYRNRLDEVRFMELNDVTYRLLALLKEYSNLNGAAILEVLAREKHNIPEESILRHGMLALNELRAKGIILGGLKATCP